MTRQELAQAIFHGGLSPGPVPPSLRANLHTSISTNTVSKPIPGCWRHRRADAGADPARNRGPGGPRTGRRSHRDGSVAAHWLPALYVRKKAKEYGTCQFAEGGEFTGKKLLIVEDVITTGGQVLLSAEDLRKAGAVDRARGVCD